MNELREQLLEAYHTNNLLQVLLKFTYAEKREQISDLLAELHNDGAIDLLEPYMNLHNDPKNPSKFFSIRYPLEKALPRLNAEVEKVMICVQHLAKEAGRDQAANSIYKSFIGFCESNPTRIEQALNLIKESPTQFGNFISSVVIAGTRNNMDLYLTEAISLTDHTDIEIRKSAVFSIGQIQYNENNDLTQRAIDCLEKIVTNESDDHLLANAINSTCKISKINSNLLDQYERIIGLALFKGSDNSFHAASEVFAHDADAIPQRLLNLILENLLNINPQNKGTVDMIDYGVANLLKRDPPDQAIEFLENLIVINNHEFSIDDFDSVVHYIQQSDKKLLNRLLTRWFLKGEKVLCNAIYVLASSIQRDELQLEIDPNEITDANSLFLNYLARKATGYLFIKPVTCASIIISLMKQTNETEVIKEMGYLLFEPLLINYPGKLHAYLTDKANCESGQIKETISKAINEHKSYIEELKSVDNIPEMHPSQNQREAHNRYVNQEFSKSFKQAMKGSIITQLCSKSVILYGNKSVHYINESSGKSRRMEIPLSAHETSMEFPRLSHIDPFRIDYMLRVFRAERIVTK